MSLVFECYYVSGIILGAGWSICFTEGGSCGVGERVLSVTGRSGEVFQKKK